MRLKPDVHVFGHTHFGYDMVIEGIRYLQAALATPMERAFAGSIVNLGDAAEPAEPCLLWDSATGLCGPYHSAWSLYYGRYGRSPEVTGRIPSVCSNLYGASKSSKSGWQAGRMPIWLFGTKPCRLKEAQVVIDEVRTVTGLLARRENAKLRDAQHELRAPPMTHLCFYRVDFH